MNRRLLLLGALVACLPAATPAAPPGGYEIVDLGALGGSESFAAGLIDLGQVVGTAQTDSGELHAFLWDAGAMPDTVPPTIESLSASPSALMEPDHEMVLVTLSATVTDAVDPAPTMSIVSVSSNEPVNGTGDGNTATDWEIVGSCEVKLRAERSGAGSGRCYTTTVAATDASGNTSTATVEVPVSHDRRR
jgi:probable HAF family extracellular repeat protein